jgi:hypothetical protein
LVGLTDFKAAHPIPADMGGQLPDLGVPDVGSLLAKLRRVALTEWHCA